MILAGDVGGTKILLGLFRRDGGALREIRRAAFASAEVASVAEPIRAFLSAGGERPSACALGVAAPVVGGRSGTVNLPWTVDARRVARAAGVPRAVLLNDVEAAAWGLTALPPRRLLSLDPALRSRPGTVAVVAAGTGFGVAALHRDGASPRVTSGEGGHAAWAPTRPEDLGLWRALGRRHGRVSLDRVVCGPGLEAIFQEVAATGPRPGRRALAAIETAPDRAAAIADLALAGDDRAASVALDRFVRYLGAAAGDVALTFGATGGVAIAGGIAPKILPRLEAGGLLEAFRDKGRLSPYLARIPVKVVLDPGCALLGAAVRAALDRPQDPSARRRATPTRR